MAEAYTAAQWFPMIEGVCRELWPDDKAIPTWIEAQLHTESGGDPKAQSAAGAVGLMQLMPATAEEVGLVVQPPSRDDRLIPVESIRGGVRYLRKQFEALGEIPSRSERLLWALASYNCGRGYIDFGGDPKTPNSALELAKHDFPHGWYVWDVGRWYLMHRDCKTFYSDHARFPDYLQVWNYVDRIREYRRRRAG